MPLNHAIRCVINFAKGGWYSRGQERLRSSLIQTGFEGHSLLFHEEHQIGAPSHEACPYGFKPYALKYAKEKGYAKVLWCDASVWAIRNIAPLFDYLNSQSHVFFLNTCTGNWTSDACLEGFGLTREEAMQIPMLMGICMGFNLTSEVTDRFLKLWLEKADDGKSFPGSWTNKNQEVSKDPRVYGHRHDQSVASILAYKLGMELIIPHETFFEYYRHPNPNGPNHGLFDGDLSLVKPHTVLIAQGM